MKTTRHFLPYLAQFFLEWEMFQTKALEKIQDTLKSVKDKVYLTWRPLDIFYHISLSSS